MIKHWLKKFYSIIPIFLRKKGLIFYVSSTWNSKSYRYISFCKNKKYTDVFVAQFYDKWTTG